jgi:hypothetical protein
MIAIVGLTLSTVSIFYFLHWFGLRADVDTCVPGPNTICNQAMATYNSGQAVTSNWSATTIKPASPPAAPVNLQAVFAAPASATVTWIGDTGNVYRYTIERSANPKRGFNEITTVDGDKNSFVDSNALSDRLGYYRVYAYNNLGNSVSAVATCDPFQAQAMSQTTNFQTTNDPNQYQMAVGEIPIIDIAVIDQANLDKVALTVLDSQNQQPAAIESQSIVDLKNKVISYSIHAKAQLKNGDTVQIKQKDVVIGEDTLNSESIQNNQNDNQTKSTPKTRWQRFIERLKKIFKK